MMSACAGEGGVSRPAASVKRRLKYKRSPKKAVPRKKLKRVAQGTDPFCLAAAWDGKERGSEK